MRQPPARLPPVATALSIAHMDLPPPRRPKMRVARFQTLFAVLGLYSLGFLIWSAISSTSTSIASLESPLHMFPIAGDSNAMQLNRHLGHKYGAGTLNDSSGNTALNQSHAPNLKCLGWKQTENCNPDALIMSNRNRTCDQFVRGGISGYCLMEDEDTGEEVHMMRTTCLSVRPEVVFSCRHAGELSDFRYAVNRLASDLAATDEPKNDPSASAIQTSDTHENGIVMVIYPKLLVSAYASIRVLRSLNCSLPIELWYSEAEMGTNVTHEPLPSKLLAEFGPITLRAITDKRVIGFNTKVHAITRSNFTNVLFLDADNVPVRDPTYLFETPEFVETGAVFWPDFWHPEHTIFNINSESLIWELLDMPFVDMFEQESGQLLIDRRRSHKALEMLSLFAFHQPNIFTRLKLVHGDKDLFRLAWLKTQTAFHMVPHPPGTAGTRIDTKFCGMSMVQMDPAGDVLFLHRNAKKLTGGRGIKHEPDTLIWTHLQRFQYLGMPSDARPTVAPPTRDVEVGNSTESEVEPETGIKTRSGKLEMTFEVMKRNYKVQIYNGAPQFDAAQWCYGQMGPLTPRFKTVSWKDTPFPDIERELLQFAGEAASLLPAPKEPKTLLAPRLKDVHLRFPHHQ